MVKKSSDNNYQQVPVSNSYLDDDDAYHSDNDDFIQRQIKNQRTQMKKQDEGLEMLSMSATRLGELSLNIHSELESQNKMLAEMDRDLEAAEANLDYVTKKTRELVQKAGGRKNFCTILILIGIILLLLFLIIYT